MARTSTERRLQQRERSRQTGAILVPLIEDFLESEVRVETEDDFRFMEYLFRRRAVEREAGVYSPSMLGSCMRQSYFAKTGVEKHKPKSPQTNGYFLEGDWRHAKWQFVLWKMHLAGALQLATVDDPTGLNLYGDGTGPAVEVRVRSTHSDDFAGTIDAIVFVEDLYFTIDFKGINLVDYQRTVRNGTKESYKQQIVGYAMIVNGLRDIPFVIKNCLLISECKPGPLEGGSPLGLHEELVQVKDYREKVRERLTELRGFERAKILPPPACVSTRHRGYQECPFARFCLDEVREIQRAREAEARASRPKNLRVARPSDDA